MGGSLREDGDYRYKISLVLPIYNVADYLAETLDSIINQSIGFKESVQLVLVNDGSTDSSGDICEQYKDSYPENVVYIKQRNGGVSAASNRGLACIEGKYVCVFGADDLISMETLREVYTFFEKHYDEIDIVSIKMDFFEGRTGPHALNYKFHTTRVIDIDHDYNQIQLSGASSFIKSSVFTSGNYKFDTRLKYTEDAKLINDIILDKRKYGVVSGPTYFYRRRLAGSSAIDGSRKDPDWYTRHIKNAYGAMMEKSKQKLGYVHKYIQSVIIYDIAGRLNQDMSTIPKDVDVKEYKRALFKLIDAIDDDVVLNAQKMARKYKLYIITKRYGINLLKDVDIQNGKASYKNLSLYDIKRKMWLGIEGVCADQGNLHIEGFISGYLFKNMNIIVESMDAAIRVDNFSTKGRHSSYCFGEKIYQETGFKVDVPYTEGKEVVFYTEVGGDKFKVDIKQSCDDIPRLSNKKMIIEYRKNSILIRNQSIQARVRRKIKSILKGLRG